MANIIEIIIKAIDQASGVAEKANQKVAASNEAMAKSFEGVGVASEAVNKKLSDYGAAVDGVTRTQNQLKQAQLEAQSAAEKLAQAQKNLAENTDPSKLDALNKELIDSQVQLDKAGKEVQDLSKNLREGKAAADDAGGGFSKMQAALVTANQAIGLFERGISIAKGIIDQTIGSTLEYAKQVRDLSTNLGITAEETSKIIQASDDYGISVESVTGALQMAVKRGFAPNIETLAKLADEYNSIQSPTERAARLTEVFGRGWTSLTPILKAGGQAIREAADEAAKLGLVLSDKDVQAARALEVQVDNLNGRVNALKLKIGKDLIPDVINVVDVFNQFGDVLQGTADPLDELNRRIGYAITFQGENSEEVARLRAEYERLKNAIKDVAMTAGERLLRSNMAQIGVSAQLRSGFLGINEAAKEQYGIYQNLTKAEDNLAAAREKALALNRAHNAQIADAYGLAVQYTESQNDQAKVQKELDDLNAKIAARGPVRVATVAAETKATTELTGSQAALNVARAAADDVAKRDNESSAQYAMRLKDAQTNLKKLTEQMGSHIPVANALSATDQKSALNQAKLAAAQEDLATAQKKKGETDAEFALRVETIKSKIDDYSKSLTAHTGIVGGATKAELEQKKALEEQIAALQKSDEINRAKGAFESLTQAFRNGTLTQTQYEERVTALNSIANLYTDSALKQATSQEILMKAFADPRGVDWYTQLVKNQDALDGIVSSTDKAAEATGVLLDKAGKPIPPIKVTVTPEVDLEAIRNKKLEKIELTIPVKLGIDPSDRTKIGHDLAGDMKYAPPTITPKVDTAQASQDITNYVQTTAKVPAEKRTNFVAVTAPAAKDAQILLNLFGTTPAKKSTEFDVKADAALKMYDDLYIAQERLHDKIIDIIVRYKTEGTPPGSNFQHGVDMIVPPNPRGGAGDYFPFMAAPGERVTVQTPAQQMTNAAGPRGGDTYIYNTNVYNPLAAAMLADKQRRDRLARSNARMGVS